MNIELSLFVDNLKFLMQQHQLNKSKFCQEIGISRTALQKYEAGQQYPNVKTLQQISQLFRVPMDVLLGVQLSRNNYEAYSLVFKDIHGSTVIEKSLLEKYVQLLRNYKTKNQELEYQVFDLKIEIKFHDYLRDVYEQFVKQRVHDYQWRSYFLIPKVREALKTQLDFIQYHVLCAYSSFLSDKQILEQVQKEASKAMEHEHDVDKRIILAKAATGGFDVQQVINELKELLPAN